MKLSLTPSDIATLTDKSGYLIIGIDDNKRIVGVSQFEEERIQQIAYTYIRSEHLTVQKMCKGRIP